VLQQTVLRLAESVLEPDAFRALHKKAISQCPLLADLRRDESSLVRKEFSQCTVPAVRQVYISAMRDAVKDVKNKQAAKSLSSGFSLSVSSLPPKLQVLCYLT
jgi:hypothetical protein